MSYYAVLIDIGRGINVILCSSYLYRLRSKMLYYAVLIYIGRGKKVILCCSYLNWSR